MLCFLAGDSAGCGGMLRFPPPPLLPPLPPGPLGPLALLAWSGGGSAEGDTVDVRVCGCWGDGSRGGDSLESLDIRSREISTVTVLGIADTVRIDGSSAKKMYHLNSWQSLLVFFFAGRFFLFGNEWCGCVSANLCLNLSLSAKCDFSMIFQPYEEFFFSA